MGYQWVRIIDTPEAVASGMAGKIVQWPGGEVKLYGKQIDEFASRKNQEIEALSKAIAEWRAKYHTEGQIS